MLPWRSPKPWEIVKVEKCPVPASNMVPQQAIHFVWYTYKKKTQCWSQQAGFKAEKKGSQGQYYSEQFSSNSECLPHSSKHMLCS